MPATPVSGVPQFVNFKITFPAEIHLARRKQNDPIDCGFFNAESTDLIASIGNIGNEEPDGLGFLNKSRKLEKLLTRDSFIFYFVKEQGNRIDRNSLCP